MRKEKDMTAKQEAVSLMENISEEDAEEIVVFLKSYLEKKKDKETKKPVIRKLGGYKGKVWISDDFDETPKDIIDSFYDEKLYN